MLLATRQRTNNSQTKKYLYKMTVIIRAETSSNEFPFSYIISVCLYVLLGSVYNLLQEELLFSDCSQAEKKFFIFPI